MLDMQVKAERGRQSFVRAVLRGANGSLDIEVLGYQFPDAVQGFDADWLVVRCTLERGAERFACEGAFLLADELAAWGAWASCASCVVSRTSLAFTEPNLRMGWSARRPNDRRVVDLELLRERPSGHAHAAAALHVSEIALRDFGDELKAIARRFPVRSSRIDVARVS